MFSSIDNGNKSNQQVSWEQRLLKNSTRQKASLKPEYQELKFTLHRKLVDKINLEALASIDNQRVRSEVRQAVISLWLFAVILGAALVQLSLRPLRRVAATATKVTELPLDSASSASTGTRRGGRGSCPAASSSG